jgi:hypothetical protein
MTSSKRVSPINARCHQVLARLLRFAVLLVVFGLPGRGHGLRLLELHFDDGPDDSGPNTGAATLNNISSEGTVLGSYITATLVGDAHRSKLNEGRYGRSLVLDGDGDEARLEGFRATQGPWTLWAWVKVDDNSKGWIFHSPKSFGIRLAAKGALELSVYSPAEGGYFGTAFGQVLPADGAWHHVIVLFAPSIQTAAISVDFAKSKTVAAPLSIPNAGSTASVGAGLKGRIDELMITSGAATDYDDLFDVIPTDCGDSALVCTEETLTVDPTDWPWKVPARLKIVRDPSRCSTAAPCPLVFIISGGGACNDDYARAEVVANFAKAGFIAATVDPYCDATDAFYIRRFPSETSQLIQVKDHLMAAAHPQRSMIAGKTYTATGCSHGANVVARWALQEQDHPARTFVRSGFMALHCAYHHGMCDRSRMAWDSLYGLKFPHDDLTPEVHTFHVHEELTHYVTPETAASRELGASWGADTSPSSPVCDSQGSSYDGCYEQGEGFTESGRQMRDAWHAAEDPSRPSGYFFENTENDCQHCLDPDDPRFSCIYCFLMHGRAAMASKCPSCLKAFEGKAAAPCAWSCCAGVGCQKAGAKPNLCTPDGGATDAGFDGPRPGDLGGDSSSAGGDGCGCAFGRVAPTPGGVALLILLLLSLSSRSGSRGRRPSRRPGRPSGWRRRGF